MTNNIGPKIALSVNFRKFSYKECFAFLEGIKCDGVELMLDPKYLILNPHPLMDLSKTFKVPVISFHAPLFLVPYLPRIFFKQVLRMSDFFPDVKNCVLHLSSLLEYYPPQTHKIADLLILAREQGLTLCFESNPSYFPFKLGPKITYSPFAFGDFCLKNNLSITFDTSHVASAGVDIAEFYEKYYKNIKNIHLSDYKNGKEHLPLGHGNLPLETLLKSIKEHKMNPQITLELNKFPGVKQKAAKVRIVHESIEYIRKNLE